MSISMASSSSSSSTPDLKYDVFLSFRGEDTRDNFTSHLNEALSQRKIKTFIDNELVRGDEISLSLLNAIEQSKISVIIFSKSYAASRWCLEELVKIIECKSMFGQIVIPIFYHVNPSHVRNQSEDFGDAFVKLEDRFKEKLEKVQRWRLALTEAANLSGFDSNVIRPESELVKKIVQDILKKLKNMSSGDNKDLIGVELRIKHIVSLLCIESNDGCVVGIWGIGGIGKTTLAHAVFNKISTEFEGTYFAESVREKSEKNELVYLRKELLSSILQDENDPNIGLIFTKERLARKKVLIVFDDVTNLKQIEDFIGDLKCLSPRSRIIITTRDKQILKSCGVDDANICEIKGLCHDDALQLFRRYAFRLKPATEDFMELSNRVVRYCNGVPLALKVFGSFLADRRKQDWESAISKLEKFPHLDIQKVLKVSYDGLDDEEKDIFLDIACFFKGADKSFVITFLDACGFSAEIGINVLVDKSLIFMFEDTITMHDLLQSMGKEIVRQESIKDPGKRSRLWHHADIYHVLTKNMGTKRVEGISLDMSEMKEVHLNPRAFLKMCQLRYFNLYNSTAYRCCDQKKYNKVLVSRGLKSNLTELRYLRWYECPLKSLEPNFIPWNLVKLELQRSKVEQLWDGIQPLVNLKCINLQDSRHLTEIPDLSLAQNLESLILEGCASLNKISSIDYLDKLVILDVRDCTSLCSLPSSLHSKSLETVYISGCPNLKRIPAFPCNVKFLDLHGTAICELRAIEHLSSLSLLDLGDCPRLESHPSNFSMLKFHGSERMTNEIGNLEVVESLEAPSWLKNLQTLYLKGCRLQELVGVVFSSLSRLSRLVDLDLTDCQITELPNSLGQLISLEALTLSENKFESIPTSIKNLPKLVVLRLNDCQSLQSLPKLPECLTVQAENCASLEMLSDLSLLFSVKFCEQCHINLSNCFKLDLYVLRDQLKDGLLRFQHSEDQGNAQEFYEALKGSICFPGNEIPKWFSYQTIGSCMTIELPPDWNNKNFLGFAMCVVVEFQDHIASDTFTVYCHCKTKRKDGDQIEDRNCMFAPWAAFSISETLSIQQDHVFLWLDLSMHQPESVWCPLDSGYLDLSDSYQADIQFSFVEEFNCGLNCELKKCGIHLVYAHDYRDPMEKSSRNFNSDEVEEEEKGKMEEYSRSFNADEEKRDEPYSKRLKIFST